MSAALDTAWVNEVIRWCDPVVASAGVGFTRQVHYNDKKRALVDAFLWEADARQFAARYPDSGIAESYGDQWSIVHCLDYWVHLDRQKSECRLNVEGWDLPEIAVPLRDIPLLDASAIARTLARILAVPPPNP